mmetsp:Transcript_8446/g.20015  ORF Transcript_8446/g.20015 Transcript_8446/m.20015 type:complete len:673 (+) Transcript_8446:118-2136(+)
MALRDALWRRRHGLFLVLCVVSYVAGVVSVYYYPTDIKKRTYISENAFLPASAAPLFSGEWLVRAADATSELETKAKQLRQSKAGSAFFSQKVAEHVAKELRGADFDASVLTFTTPPALLDAVRLNATLVDQALFAPTAHDANRVGSNVYAVHRPGRASGNEALILSATLPAYRLPPHLEHFHREPESTSGVGLLIALAHMLARAPYLSKNIVLVLTDGSQPHALERFLEQYFGGDVAFDRAGNVVAAMHLDMPIAMATFERMCVSLAGPGGALPNLDLVNVMGRIVSTLGLWTGFEMSCTDFAIEDIFGEAVARNVPPQHAQLVQFMMEQARGVPASQGGLYLQYSINSITVSMRSDKYPIKARNMESTTIISHPMLNFARLLELYVRSLSNLSEYLHQSWWFYLLSHPYHYIPIGDYMITWALLCAPLLLCLVRDALLLMHGVGQNFILSVVYGFAFSVGGLVALVAPAVLRRVLLLAKKYSLTQASYSIEDIALLSFTLSVVVFSTLLSLLWLHQRRKSVPRVHTRAVRLTASIPLLVVLGMTSLLNFSFSYIVAVLFVPVYLATELLTPPLPNGDSSFPPTTTAHKPTTAPVRIGVARRAFVVIVVAIMVATVGALMHQQWQTTLLREYSRLLLTFELYGSFAFPFLVVVAVPLLLSYVWLAAVADVV